MQHTFKAPNQDHEVDHHQLYRDTRSTYQQFIDNFKSPLVMGSSLLGLAFVPFIEPQFTFICALTGFMAFALRFAGSTKESLPFRMPFTSFKVDYGDPTPGRRGFAMASGTFYVGNIFHKTPSELWLGIKDMLTHTLIFGTTGSGKTETLVSLSFNTMAMGSGLFYVDPKGSPKLIAQLYVMSRICGRDDDFRCINYLTTEKAETGQKAPRRTSNTTNPFSYGNAESLSNMLNSLIPKAEGGNAIFNANARNLMKTIMYALVEMRNSGEIQLSSKVIRDYLTLTQVLALAERKDLSVTTQDALRAFLSSVGWQEGKTEKEQPKSLAEQFGYAKSYFGDPLNNLTDTFGHLYGTAFGEVDMRDIVMNRRILAIIIPSLAMAQEEVKSLGVMSLSAIRIAISVGLGTGKESTFSETLFALPTDAPAPFLSITDEYAAIPTPGYIEVLTQGRGLGIAAIVASQDYAGISKADKEGAQQLLENTKTKLFLKMSDCGETFEVLKKLAGDVSIMETSGMAIKPETGGSSYRDNLQTNIKERAKVVLADMQNQIEGEFHGFLGSTMVRGRSFYANPPLDPNMITRYNHLVAISPPDRRDIEMQFAKVPSIIANLVKNYERIEITQKSREGGPLSLEERIAEAESQIKHSLSVSINTAIYGDSLLTYINTQVRMAFDNPLRSSMDSSIVAFVDLGKQFKEHDDHNLFDDYFDDPIDDYQVVENSGDNVFDDEPHYDDDEDNYQPHITEKPIVSEPESSVFDVFSSTLTSHVDEVEEAFTGQPATGNPAQLIKDTSAAIINKYPRQPAPKDEVATKDFLSKSLSEMLANANKKKK